MIEWKEIVIRLSLAALFGAIIGLERERKNWAAGLRTHMLVCVGSALTMMVSAYGFMDVLGPKNIVLDPSRIAAQVISGIGFIGAGTILFLRQGIVRGLTTAAGLWTVAAIGLATGGGMYFAAAVTTFSAIIILLILQPFEKKIAERFISKRLKITTSNKNKLVQILNDVLQDNSLKIASFSTDKTGDDYTVIFLFEQITKTDLSELVNSLHDDPDIKEVVWNK